MLLLHPVLRMLGHLLRWRGTNTVRRTGAHHHRLLLLLHGQAGDGHGSVSCGLWGQHVSSSSSVFSAQVDLQRLLTIKGGHAPETLVTLSHSEMVLSQIRGG